LLNFTLMHRIAVCYFATGVLAVQHQWDDCGGAISYLKKFQVWIDTTNFFTAHKQRLRNVNFNLPNRDITITIDPLQLTASLTVEEMQFYGISSLHEGLAQLWHRTFLLVAERMMSKMGDGKRYGKLDTSQNDAMRRLQTMFLRLQGRMALEGLENCRNAATQVALGKKAVHHGSSVELSATRDSSAGEAVVSQAILLNRKNTIYEDITFTRLNDLEEAKKWFEIKFQDQCNREEEVKNKMVETLEMVRRAGGCSMRERLGMSDTDVENTVKEMRKFDAATPEGRLAMRDQWKYVELLLLVFVVCVVVVLLCLV